MYCWCNTTNESAAYPSTTLKCGAKEKPKKIHTIYMKHLHILRKTKNTLTLTQYLNVNSQFHISTFTFSFDLWVKNATSALSICKSIQSINSDFFYFIDEWLKSIKMFCLKLITRFKHYVITCKWGLTQKPISIVKVTNGKRTYFVHFQDEAKQ